MSSMASSHPVLVPADEALFLSDAEFEEHLGRLLSASPRVIAASPEVTMMDTHEAHSEVSGKSQEQETSPKTGQPFVDGLHAYAVETAPRNVDEALRKENKMLTTNQGVTNASTKDPRLDLFTDLEKTIQGDRLRALLEESWGVSPIDTLRIIWNARSIHLGKGERASYYRCIGWLKQDRHPKTILLNLLWAVRPVIEKKAPKTQDEDEDEDVVLVDKVGKATLDDQADDQTARDIPTGVAHGYWKDLLNLLVLEVNGKLNVMTDPNTILQTKRIPKGGKPSGDGKRPSLSEDEGGSPPNKRQRDTTSQFGTHRPRGGGTQRGPPRGTYRPQRITSQAKSEAETRARRKETPREERLSEATRSDLEMKQAARERRHREEQERHGRFLERFENQADGFYRALHLTIARLFAAQLKRDMRLLRSGKKGNIKRISPAAKWAPSLEHLHDRHTFIASSIAEILCPASAIGKADDSRETYLKRAREQYHRLWLAPLRKALRVVERDVSAETFNKIDYQRVPSLAMNCYQDLFLQKDPERFAKYIDDVALGKKRISGAVLQPAALILQAQNLQGAYVPPPRRGKQLAKAMVMERETEVNRKLLNGQWNTLVQRIRDSGKLESAIAVCDVSGSMESPVFRDGTAPYHSAVGLSLLLAEVTQPPFGGNMITFSERPRAIQVGGASDCRTLVEKVRAMTSDDWGLNTNLVAVFEDLILPMAVEHKVKPEDMVKQIFVFSDMQFDAAQSSSSYHRKRPDVPKFETHYERLKEKFSEAGYPEMPRLIFWNLAGGAQYDEKLDGASGSQAGVAPKPVTAEVPGTALVSGYSQAQMKMFLDGGLFYEKEADKEDETMVVLERTGDGGDGDVVEVEKKDAGEKMNPLSTLMKAINHPAYSMLRVVD